MSTLNILGRWRRLRDRLAGAWPYLLAVGVVLATRGCQAREVRRSTRQLTMLDGRLLADLGFDHGEIERMSWQRRGRI